MHRHWLNILELIFLGSFFYVIKIHITNVQFILTSYCEHPSNLHIYMEQSPQIAYYDFIRTLKQLFLCENSISMCASLLFCVYSYILKLLHNDYFNVKTPKAYVPHCYFVHMLSWSIVKMNQLSKGCESFGIRCQLMFC